MNKNECLRLVKRYHDRLAPKFEYLVDTRTDAKRALTSQEAVLAYLTQNNVAESDTIWDFSRPNYATVAIPAWKDEQDAYCAAKAVDCARWGCE